MTGPQDESLDIHEQSDLNYFSVGEGIVQPRMTFCLLGLA